MRDFVSMIIDPHACVFDACMMPISMMRLKFCLGRKDEQGDSRSWMYVFMMHMSTILDPDACVHDARMYVACIYDPRSLTLMHVCMMHIPMILDPDACVYDAGMNDAYIHDL